MALQERLRDDLKVALKGHDASRVSILRILLAECRNEEKARMKPLDDAAVIDVLGREAKRRKESIEAFQSGNRTDLVSQEQVSLSVIEQYLPEQMSRDEIAAVVRDAIAASGAQSPKDRGKVMAYVMPQVKGRASGKDVGEIAGEMLAEAGE